jgi:hypothetical protein
MYGQHVRPVREAAIHQAGYPEHEAEQLATRTERTGSDTAQSLR